MKGDRKLHTALPLFKGVALAFLCLLTLILQSCTGDVATTPPPRLISIPHRSVVPNMERTEEQVRKVEEKVDEVEAAVRDVGSQIEASNKTALSIETAVGEAYSNGLEAGSGSAVALQALVADLKESIAASASAREMAMEALTSAKRELSATTQANAHLRGQIATITANNDEMFWKLSDANDQLKIGIQVAKERDEAIKNTLTIITERDNALKYKRGVWIGISLIILYILARIAIATGKWTPQGKIARLFL